MNDARASEAQAILQRHKSVDLTARGTAYRQSGWSSFDNNALAYTSEEVVRERGRFSAI